MSESVSVTEPPLAPLWTPQRLADAVGCLRSHIYQLISRGVIRSIKIGDARRIADAEARRVVTEGAS